MQTSEAYRLLIADVYELAGLSRRTSAALAAEHGQTVAGWHLMSVLKDRPLTVSAAARRLGLARQGIQRIATALAGQGLVKTSDNPDHKTAPLFGLTPAGERLLTGLVTAADRDRGVQLDRLSCTTADLLAARVVLRQVIDALDDGAAGQRTTS